MWHSQIYLTETLRKRMIFLFATWTIAVFLRGWIILSDLHVIWGGILQQTGIIPTETLGGESIVFEDCSCLTVVGIAIQQGQKKNFHGNTWVFRKRNQLSIQRFLKHMLSNGNDATTLFRACLMEYRLLLDNSWVFVSARVQPFVDLTLENQSFN